MILEQPRTGPALPAIAEPVEVLQAASHTQAGGFFRLIANYGFMQTPSVPEILKLAKVHGLDIELASTTFYLGRETLLTGGGSKMMSWRKSLFAFMSRNAWNATTFFGIPQGRVVELGSQVEL